MKKIYLTILVLFALTITVKAQQVSLFDTQGEARAYIDFGKDATIFMWDGTPVAFLEKDGRDICVFGFNRSFLGWYVDGIIYDKKGYVVGAKKGATNKLTKVERVKSVQKIVPIRPITPITPIQPLLKSSWSSTLLSEFLFLGKK